MGDDRKIFDARAVRGEGLAMAPKAPNPRDAVTLIDCDIAAVHPLRPMLTAGLLSLVLFVLACALCYVVVRASPPPLTKPLMIVTAIFIMLWGTALAVIVARRVGHAELVQVWSRLAVLIIVGSHIACVGLIWGIMPYVSPAAQLLMAVPLIGCVPTQLICSPENTAANRSGVITVIGSLALFFATRGNELAALAALYIAGFGVVMFVLGDRIAATVRATVAARLASESAAIQLDRLLTEVAAQRDAKTRFMAAASHDLGQPLAAAALFFDQSLRTTDDLARAKAIDGVRRAFASAEQLLSHMLGHLRLEADAVEVHRSPVAVRTMLVRLAQQHGPAAAAAAIDIRCYGGRETLLLDPALIERAVGNLVDNAIRHSGASRIVIGARRRGNAVRLLVLDNGVGVAPIDAPHIFDAYYQANAGGARLQGGFGLGLSSVLRLATLMGGTASYDPQWLRGAAFYLEFPTNLCVTKRSRRAELAA
jgi:signal transduction histidine kinase